MLGEGHHVNFRLVGDEVRVDPGDVKVLAMKEVSALHLLLVVARADGMMAGFEWQGYLFGWDDSVLKPFD